MYHLFGQFAALAIRYPELPVTSLYNKFVCILNNDEASFVDEYAMLFVHVAEAARSAPESMKKEIIR